MRWLWAAGLALMASGCAGRARVPAPTEGHRPEPVALVMMPVAEVRTPPLARDIMQHLADSAISSPAWRNARWGVLIVDATTGDTMYAHDADKLFMPASNQKLLTGAVAMQVLGPEYRWRTPVLLRGAQRGRVFFGDLIVVGRGDPSVSDSLRVGGVLSTFDPIADALSARGITRVAGRIVTDGDAFPGPSSGFGWEVDDLDTPSGAAVDELLFNEGVLRVTVRGAAKAKRPATVERWPTTSYPPVSMEAVTRVATDSGPAVDVVYDSVAATLRVTGTIAVGDSARFTMSYRHPNDAYRAAMLERLLARGIRLTNRTRAPSARVHVDTLVTLESAPLREVLRRMQKPSQNQIAELLFRTSGLVATGDGSADSARALAVRTLGQWGVRPDQLAYRDGSGLSRHDYVSPRALVHVLDAMHRAPWAMTYRQALPLAGVDGTIGNRMRSTPAAGNANAKTGTLDKARSLSGYVTTADGHLILFSMLANNFTVPTREVERVQDLLVSTLAGMRVGNGAKLER
ncbi:MAG: D-alanyl-D-alanine carboxypeptidase/D-alanyl-D-alanine-endopeptidase [Gemmatimonadaceae bacterium]|nr:D-alanyl-D-alanine carboxypeptidase/D-alanyl-D-alanine-endopeptidase [Gemmatimonadaceae bacterium]